MVGNDSRSPTGSMCCSWAWSIWKGRTLSSKAALASQLLSCNSAGAVPSVLCSEAAPVHVPATVRLLKAGDSSTRGEWGGRRRFMTPSRFSIGLLLEGKWGQLVLPGSALFLIHRKKYWDLVPCHCRLTQRIIWTLWLGENGSLCTKIYILFWVEASVQVQPGMQRCVRCSGFVQGQLTQSQGLSVAGQGKGTGFVSSSLFRAGLLKPPVTAKQRPQF